MKFIVRQTLTILTACVFSLSAIAEQAGMPAEHQAMPVNTGNRVYGKVVETMDVDNYTYVQIDTGEKKYWAAGPKTSLKKGAMIAFDTQMPFTDFESKALNKKFKVIYFVSSFVTDQPGQAAQTAAAAEPHANLMQQDKPETIKKIKKAADGLTIAEIFKQKKNLVGKVVRVRGQVVKYTPEVMGKNWLHIQDNSGSQKLVVTTDQTVKKGDIVLVTGKLEIDKDLGYGYVYEVIIEQAKVAVE